MALTPGTRFGVYQVTAQIGEGGMGQVYRARDTQLDRDVAIKILPEAFAHDADRLARFQREAKTLASLNHPNIAIIHGLEQAGDVRALVMELVEGEDLSQRIARGAIPIDEALPIAKQIADALEAAHEQGIIHRDLKPANIKVRSDGTVKVLDFGLAKAMEPTAGPSPSMSMSPTITTPAMTQAGMILGTAAYMSPEPARGKTVDKRADIWAFGAVLYEMLTGRRAFPGADTSETLAGIIKSDPDWSALSPTVPASIRRVMGRCLTKDAKERLRDIGDARQDLAGPLSPPATASPIAAGWHLGASWRLALVCLVVAVGAAMAAGVAVWSAMRPVPPRVTRTTIVTAGTGAQATLGEFRSVAVTEDGTRVVYTGNGGSRLFVRPLDQLEPTVLAAGSPRGAFISPDGQWVGYSQGGGVLMKVAITGGPSVTLGATDGSMRGATWAKNDTIIFATANPMTGLQRMSAAGGTAEVLTKPDVGKGEVDHLWPELLPDQRGVLFTIMASGGGLDAAQIAVRDLETGAQKVLLRGGSDAHYVPSGHLVYAAGGALRAVPFHLGRREVTGPPVPVLPLVVTTSMGAAQFAVASDGTLVYLPGEGDTPTGSRPLVWIDRQGREEPIAVPPRGYVYPRISPDGTGVALWVQEQQNDIWIWDFTRQTLTRFTFEAGVDNYPLWTPDGRRLLFSSQRAGPRNLFWQAADGTGSAERLTVSPKIQVPYTITPDGTRVVFRQDGDGGGSTRDLMMLSLQGEHRVEPLLATSFDEVNAELSPDGRWLAYQSNESGRYEVYVRPFPDVNTGRWQVSSGGGTRPLWARSGQELFYLATSGLTTALMRVPVDARSVFTPGVPTKLFDGRFFLEDTPGTNIAGGGRTYDISPDGRRFLVVKADAGGDPNAAHVDLVVVQNWMEELKRLVPMK